MLKELIVSVNGREKKIAIIENGKVTEFYIERGESEQGIVGNIYKGRVMRVLPGMQSAFVDIGLERDAFLYVSDFFDEEEEFERIVIDKAKEGAPAAAAGIMAAPERDSAARRPREVTGDDGEEAPPAGVQTDDRAVAPQPSSRREGRDGRDGRDSRTDRRGRRDEPRGGRQQQPPESRTAFPSPQSVAEPDSSVFVTIPPAAEEEAIETPFAGSAFESSFERISDDDERAAEDGSMLKDAIMQERILDRIHAVEFDLDRADAPIDLSSTFANVSAASFQRIDDGEEGETPVPETDRVQEAVAAHIKSFLDEANEQSLGREQTAPLFERISDDEAAAGEPTALGASPSETVAVEKPARRSARGKAGGTTSNATTATRRSRRSPKADAAEPVAEAATVTEAEAVVADEASAPKRGRGGSRAKVAAGRTAKGAASRRASTGGNKRAAKTDAPVNGEGELPDAEASVGSSPSRGEFATRRGGRRRRRGSSNNGGKQANEAAADDRPPQNGESGDGESEAPFEVAEVVSAVAAAEAGPPAASAAPVPERHAAGGGNSNRQRADGRERGGGRGRRNERPPQPTITDLLREGQEIIVQIAKEPISQKGARITSHIALPGRFLVYMPTIEHVGVSRKIESDGERARLRKLIQAIRAEEDVPSGGFIVRTAGVGISEEDLRDDARYLVRTWLDIRRSAEKAKAPALAHRDLDLVQRLLRDQLSDEFTAIRVDSEDEYQRIVEFVNRIQPRLVKRVKLYTREESILEAYGVQAEIDKAVKPRVWLRSGGYLVINQTEALVAIDVNTGKFVGRGGNRLEDTITKTNLEAVDEIVRQIRLRDLGGIIVLDLIDMEERRNRQRVMQALQEALQNDKSPTKVLSFNDFGLVIMTRKRVKQSLERTLCAPCPYCQGAGLVKSPQTVCYEILEEARRLSRGLENEPVKQVTLRVNPEVARALRGEERDVMAEIEEYLGALDLTSDESIHQEQFDFAFV